MKTTINNSSQFSDAFNQAGRGSQFSYEALGLLFEYFEEIADPDMELDVIAICCDYTEDDAVSIAGNYDIDIADMNEEEALEAVQDYLNSHTSVVGTTSTGSIVYADF